MVWTILVVLAIVASCCSSSAGSAEVAESDSTPQRRSGYYSRPFDIRQLRFD
jgi:outer membrane PBP1 activator LpoA protein